MQALPSRRQTVRRLALNPDLAVGEAYMDSGLVPLGGSIHDVVAASLCPLLTTFSEGTRRFQTRSN
jgi:hypothetical protein